MMHKVEPCVLCDLYMVKPYTMYYNVFGREGERMTLTDAKRRANNKYIREHMTTLGCKMRKDDAAEFKAACAALGTTPNAVFRAAAQEIIEQYRGKDQPKTDT